MTRRLRLSLLRVKYISENEKIVLGQEILYNEHGQVVRYFVSTVDSKFGISDADARGPHLSDKCYWYSSIRFAAAVDEFNTRVKLHSPGGRIFTV